MTNLSTVDSTRRNLLLGAAASALLAPLSSPLHAAQALPHELIISLYNLHTGEKLTTRFWENGKYDPRSLQEINVLLRDHRTGDIKFIDPRLYSILVLANRKLGNIGEIHVISGYRSPKTNKMLAARSSGVARNSYHMSGRAIDLRIPGYKSTEIRDAGLQLGVGGVGYYPTSDFVHLDTGPRRNWQGS